MIWNRNIIAQNQLLIEGCHISFQDVHQFSVFYLIDEVKHSKDPTLNWNIFSPTWFMFCTLFDNLVKICQKKHFACDHCNLPPQKTMKSSILPKLQILSRRAA